MIDKLHNISVLGAIELQKLTGKKLNELINYQKPIVLTGSTVVVWNLRKGYNSVLSLDSNKTLAFDQLTPGDYGTIVLRQDSTGSRLLTIPNNSIVMGTQGTNTMTLSTLANSIDIATFYYDGTNIFWNVILC